MIAIGKTKTVVTSLADVAAVFGKTPRTAKNWKASGMPGKPRNYSIPEIFKWLTTQGPYARDGGPAAEQYRQAKAELAKLELARKRGELVPAEEVAAVFDAIGSLLRNAGEVFQRQYGPEALDILNDALDEAERTFGTMIDGDQE